MAGKYCEKEFLTSLFHALADFMYFIPIRDHKNKRGIFKFRLFLPDYLIALLLVPFTYTVLMIK
jgi:hypothetical protein